MLGSGFSAMSLVGLSSFTNVPTTQLQSLATPYPEFEMFHCWPHIPLRKPTVSWRAWPMKSPVTKRPGLGVAKGMYNQYPSGYGLCSIYLYTYTFTDICDGKMYGWIFIYIYDLCEYTTYVNTSAAGIPSAQHFSGLPPRHKAWSMAKPKGKRPLTALITSQQQI